MNAHRLAVLEVPHEAQHVVAQPHPARLPLVLGLPRALRQVQDDAEGDHVVEVLEPALVLGLLLRVAARGAATHAEMLEDVRRALRWVRTNRASLVYPGTGPARRLVFGGYSSGAHVAASLLARPGPTGQWLPLPKRLLTALGSGYTDSYAT